MSVLLSVSVAVLAGLMMTRVVHPLKLPDVTAYLLAGVLIGPYCLGALGIHGLGFTSAEAVASLSLMAEVALGFIAFAIGNEFRISALKHTGRQAVIVGIVQALMATLFVDVALLGLYWIFPGVITPAQAITLGAIATATAPAATLMVVRQYKAHGPLTDLLLPVVALDDAVGLVVFAVSFGIARTLSTGVVDLVSILLTPIVEISASLLLGAALGWLLTQLEKLFHSNTNRLNLTIAFVFLTVSLSMSSFEIGGVHVSFSSLLVCMMLGTVFCNLCPLSLDLMEKADKWTSPLLALFFVVSGAELELSVFGSGTVIGLGVVYIVFRSLGKCFGAYVSTRATHCSSAVCKYLGITLLPQAGVALGMCLTARQLGEEGDLIRNIILFSVLIYELFGPMCTRWALTQAGDIKPKSEAIKNRREEKIKHYEENPHPRQRHYH
ncbi:MAG: sodium:proton antiporter [Ruminococcaceae bacterium]|nr:sodium:proton antiporter [Oscillospiraceae bacterium]